MMSCKIQNKRMKALVTYVRRVTLNGMDKLKMFAIMLDETTDVSHVKQVFFIVHFVHKMVIKEYFLQVCERNYR